MKIKKKWKKGKKIVTLTMMNTEIWGGGTKLGRFQIAAIIIKEHRKIIHLC